MAAEDATSRSAQTFLSQPKTMWLERLFPEAAGSVVVPSVRKPSRQNRPVRAAIRPSGAWWGKLPDESYYCRAHHRSLEIVPASAEGYSGPYTGRKLACPVCGNWMLDIRLEEN